MNQLTRLSLYSLASLGLAASLGAAQAKSGGSRAKAETAGQSQIERGQYIVEHVAMCETCHTPRNESGTPIKNLWLMGGPTQLRPAYQSDDWAVIEPRLAGRPPGTDADFIRLLTTGIARTGLPPKPPMPPFRMTRSDAEAVLAYLKSLKR